RSAGPPDPGGHQRDHAAHRCALSDCAVSRVFFKEMEMQMPDMLEGSVLVFRQGPLGRIKLNRPKALNSLNLEMVGLIDAALDRFEQDSEVVAVLLDGSGERALCAGGDIRELYDAGKA